MKKRRLLKTSQLLEFDQALDLAGYLGDVENICSYIRKRIHNQLNHTENPVHLREYVEDINELKTALARLQEHIV